MKIHFENLKKKFKNCVKYQTHLIQQYLNEIILIKLKTIKKILKILLQKFKTFWKFMAKIWNNFKTFIEIFANFILKFIKIILKLEYLKFKINYEKRYWDFEYVDLLIL